jgi:uncharacterized protein YdiU (UPF0061 family)
MRAKLGLYESRAGDDTLIADWLIHLEEQGLDYTLSFRKLANRLGASEKTAFGDVEARWCKRVTDEGRDVNTIRSAMNAVNPLYIPRNHRVEEAIQGAVDGDLTVFEELRSVLDEPFAEHAVLAHLADAPEPQERVLQTFCGT